MQMRRHFTITAQGGLAIAAMLASCRSGFREAAEGVAAPSERSAAGDDPADVVLRQVAFARSTGGLIVARGTAARATWRQAAGKLEATAVEARLARGSQAPAELGELAIHSPQAEGELASRSGSGWGGVELRAARGDLARTERVLIDGAAGNVFAPGPVEAAGPGYRVRGSALTARSDGTRVQLTGGILGRLTPPGAAP